MWDSAKEAQLEEKWRAGELSEVIGGYFGVSPEAVRAKAFHMGLPRRKLSAAFRRKRRAFKREGTPYRPEAPKPIIENPDDIAGVSFLDREEGQCAWPVGDPQSPEFGCCGSETLAGKDYCAEHERRAHSPVPPGLSDAALLWGVTR